MADYFTQFSCVLEIGSVANATWALDLYETLRLEYSNEGEDLLFDVSVDATDPQRLLIGDPGSGDTNQVIEFVRRCAHALDLSGLWGFEWANTCSRPHLDAFGGGAVVIDLEDGRIVDSVSTNYWLTRYLESGVSHAGSH